MNKAIALNVLLGIFTTAPCLSMEPFKQLKKKFMKKNEEVQVPEVEDDDSIPHCVICLLSLSEPLMQVFGCSCAYPHVYHKSCWAQMVKNAQDSGKSVQCPQCRQEVLSVEKISLSHYKIQEYAREVEILKKQCQEISRKNEILKREKEVIKNKLLEKKRKREQEKKGHIYKFKEIITPVAFGCTASVLLVSLFQVDEPGILIAFGGALGSLCGVLSSGKKALLVDEQRQDAEEKIEAIFYGTFLLHVACCSVILAGICLNHFSCWAIPAK